MSNPVSHEPITCPSCEYRYSSGNAICPMCGSAAPVVEPIEQPSPVPNEFRTDYKTLQSSLNSQPRPPHPGLRRLVAVVVVLIGLMVVTSFFYKARRGNQPKESGPAIKTTATLGQIKPTAGKQHIVHNQVRGVQHVVAAKPETAQTTSAAKEDDPVELWKAVTIPARTSGLAADNLK